jgi:predicted amidohydrolase
MKATLTLALCQCTPAPLDVTGNLARLAQAAHQARQQGAEVLVCPEMFLTGYHLGHAAVQQLAQAADGAYAQAVAAIARQHHIALVYGYPERGAHGTVFNAAQWISAEGQRCLNYRKTHLFGALDRAQFAASAPASTLLELGGWRIGLLICYDVEFPENAQRLARAGADLLVVPTANMVAYDFVPEMLIPVRAYDNQIFIAYANYAGHEAELHYGGLSTVAGPGGQVLARAGRDAALLLVTLERQQLQVVRHLR